MKNVSLTVWPSRGQPDGSLLINVADAWFRNDGKSLVTNTDGRAGLLLDLWPGKAADIRLQITAPVQAGEYILEIDLVQEGVAWFKDKGSQTWRGRVKVE